MSTIYHHLCSVTTATQHGAASMVTEPLSPSALTHYPAFPWGGRGRGHFLSGDTDTVDTWVTHWQRPPSPPPPLASHCPTDSCSGQPEALLTNYEGFTFSFLSSYFESFCFIYLGVDRRPTLPYCESHHNPPPLPPFPPLPSLAQLWSTSYKPLLTISLLTFTTFWVFKKNGK